MPDTSPTPVDLDLDAIEAISEAERYVHPDEVLALIAEIRRLRAAISPDSERIRELEAENKKYKGALDEIDRMNPDDFRTGQGHLSAAFREVNFQAAFAHVCRVVNRTLHGIDSAEGPSR